MFPYMISKWKLINSTIFALQRLYDNEQLSPDNLEAEDAGSMSCWDLLDLPSK